ncbi:hypothetical protein [Archangium violaceum]|uniref:hypothetical protein n=1 Tax=Archangium violaceum TaxID=83451 RepID=UPI0036DAD007
MKARPMVLLPMPVDPSRPLQLTLTWDGQGATAEQVADTYGRAMKAFNAHLQLDAFRLPLAAQAETAPTGTLHVDRDAIHVTFPSYPYQPQSLGLLVRALVYQHRHWGSRVDVTLSNTEAGIGIPASARLWRTADLLECPPETAQLPFPTSVQWCTKRPLLTVQFASEVDPTMVEHLDDMVAAWVVLGDLGAYAALSQLEAPSEEESLEMLLDLPVDSGDEVAWQVTQYGVTPDCVIPLLNMLAGFHAREARLSRLLIE